MNKQVSQPGMGRKLRRARAIVKKWERGLVPGGQSLEACRILGEVTQARYERAAALILAQKLSE